MFDQGNIVSFNRELSPDSQTSISIHDRGFLYGNAVFDATLTFNGWPFELRDHRANPTLGPDFKHQ